ncbi:hypothetical protein NW752_002338 [Fusarium irregulare]|uniref:Uncharacterized protein n=1 Tax=Fusarium irregulare TaxID=2494466 RepID=A0A9W8PFV1_9HYPO|nr:hypothetical protein NW766_011055 [Fusarium irregulare]KAJ4024884.1 hypothetical protein NW752_002338 [Fusarium irregulare]
MRQIIAYHFFDRATFEEIPEKSLVRRVQVHLVKMNIPMLDTDIAQMLQAAADKIPQFFKEVNEDKVAREYRPFEDDVLKNIQAAFDIDEKMALFMERCAEPLIENESSDKHAATTIEYILDSGDFKWLMNYAAVVEKENLSWEATIGPAVKALEDLGDLVRARILTSWLLMPKRTRSRRRFDECD